MVMGTRDPGYGSTGCSSNNVGLDHNRITGPTSSQTTPSSELLSPVEVVLFSLKEGKNPGGGGKVRLEQQTGS